MDMLLRKWFQKKIYFLTQAFYLLILDKFFIVPLFYISRLFAEIFQRVFNGNGRLGHFDKERL